MIPKTLLIVLNYVICMSSTLTVHYHRYDAHYANWSLWTWAEQVTKEVAATNRDQFGLIFQVDLTQYPRKTNIGLLPKYRNWQSKDDPNRSWNPTMSRKIWLIQGDGNTYIRPPSTEPRIRKAFLDRSDQLILVLTNPVTRTDLTRLKAHINLQNRAVTKINEISLYPATSESSTIVQVKFDPKIVPSDLPGEVTLDGYQPGPVYLRYILDQPQFITSEPLGVFLSDDQTKFSLFAPGATAVILNLYDQASGGNGRQLPLNRQAGGVWSIVIAENLDGKYYTYSVDGPDPDYDPQREYIDPYATCVTNHGGRAFLYRDNTPIHPAPRFPLNEAIIYELHVRDFSIDENSGIQHKGQYLGFTETGTRLPGTDIRTGIDHLIELGINTVQLMPIQDFEHDDTTDNYFWGYMPINFSAPDGWFASRRPDATRVRELKQLVDALHRNGIKVVLDVVYNHTAEGNPDIRYNFNGIVPNYYYRQKIDGTYWNGSGCGNEVRTENPMVRRMIIESLKHWVETYDVDGFRFDLMGLIDLETMTAIVRELRNLKHELFIYGEPWIAGETPITPTVKGKQRSQKFAVFNDHFRDALKGPWYNIEPGYIQSGKNMKAVKQGISSSLTDFTDQPTEVINYVACHDGRTLWDQLIASTQDGSTISHQQRLAMHKLAAVILLTSQGIPFLHGGQEFLRSKFGAHNSYNQPDSINKIRWELKRQNHTIFDYTRGLIRLRREHPMLRMSTAEDIRRNLKFLDQEGLQLPKNCIAYHIKRGNTEDSWREILVLINPNHRKVTFTIPAGKWILVVDHEVAGIEIITPITSEQVIVKPISALVMYQ